MSDSPATKDVYLLPRDERELRRLNLQHKFLMNLVYEERFVYDESIRLGPGSRILDVGAGTGAWTVGVTGEIPESVEVTGSDISSANFPSSTPPNVKMTVTSTTSLPEAWTCQFDLVHQRLLLAALQREEWPVVLEQMFRVLKSEGAVQLVEFDLSPKSKGPAMEELLHILQAAYAKNNLILDIARKLDTFLEKAGFVDIRVEKKYMPMGKMWGEYGRQGTEIMKGAFDNYAGALANAGVIQSVDEYLELMKQVEKEWDEHGVQYVAVIATARKPAGI